MATALDSQSIVSPRLHAQFEKDRQERQSQEVVVDRNERAAEKTLQRHGGMSPEPFIPDMRLSTVKSPTEEPNDSSNNYTLPVVEEAASESGSTRSSGIKNSTHNSPSSTKLPPSIISKPPPRAPSRAPPLTPPQEPTMPNRAPPLTPPELAAELDKRLQFDLQPGSDGVTAAAAGRQVKA